MKRRTILGGAGASLLAAPAIAQSFPSKPIQMIVPYPPGGGTDGFGRITSDMLSEKLGQQIIIRNIGGASSVTGSDTVRRADPDGYTLLFNASLFVLGKYVVPPAPTIRRPTSGRSPRRARRRWCCWSTSTCPAPTTPARWPRSRRSRRSTSSLSRPAVRPAMSPRSEFLRRTRLPLDTVLYKGTAPANADLLSGSVQLFMDPWTALLPLARAGKARALFVTSRARTAARPRYPDDRGSRAEGFQHQLLVRRMGAQGHARPDRRAAGRGDGRGQQGQGLHRQVRRRSASCRRRAGRRNSRPSSRARSTPTRPCCATRATSRSDRLRHWRKRREGGTLAMTTQAEERMTGVLDDYMVDPTLSFLDKTRI